MVRHWPARLAILPPKAGGDSETRLGGRRVRRYMLDCAVVVENIEGSMMHTMQAPAEVATDHRPVMARLGIPGGGAGGEQVLRDGHP